MRRHLKAFKENTTDRLHEYCCVRYPVYQAWHEHPFSSHTHWFMLVVFSLGITLGLFFQWQLLPARLARAASYSFAQTSWAGGATANTATHTSNQSGWTEYNTKDSQISLSTATQVALEEQSTTFTENFSSTTYKDTTNTTADWDTTNTRVRLDKTFFGSVTSVSLSPAGTSASTKAVAVSGNYAYIAVASTTTTDLMVVDLTNTSNVYTLDFGISGGAHDIEVSGNYAYVVTGTVRQLKVVDISSPTSPSVVATVSLSGDAWGIDVSGSNAYIADGASGLAVVDITTPTSPGTPNYKTTSNSGAAKSVVVSGSTAFVAIDSLAYLEVFDVTTPSSPTNTSSEAYSGTVRGQMAIGNNTIYLAAGSVGVIDVSTLSNPGTPSYVTVDDITRGVFVSGNYLYVADDGDGVDIYDITTPTSLTLVAEGLAVSDADDVAVASGKVYAVGTGKKLQIANTDPVNFNTPRVAQSLAIDTTSQVITKATLTATATLNSQTITYQMSRDGGTTWENVTSGSEYTFTSTSSEKSDLRWKASLSTTNTEQTPTLTSVAITYKYYPASHVLTSNIYNSQATTTQWTQISWTETVTSATNVRLQLRTSSDGTTWGDWLGPTSISDYYETTYTGETVNATQAAGANDQYLQYRAYLTSDGSATPTLYDLTISYTITPAIPTLGSSSHTSQTTYYQSYTPTMTITNGTGPTPDHYHYLVNQTASPTIAAVAAGTSTSAGFTVPGATITSDGTWYVHLVAQDSGHANSTSFSTYTIKVDATAPSPTLNFGSVTATSISVSAAGTSDATAGLHATPYYFDRNAGTANSGYVLGDWTDSTLSVNTQYTYKLKARDATSTPNESSFTSTQTKYTYASTPGTPSIVSSAATSLTVKVAVNSNPSNTEFAIQEANSGNFVQTNGTLGGTTVWQTYANWGGDSGKAVTALTPSTSYAFKVKAKNGDAVETGYSSSTSGFTGEGVPQNFQATTISQASVAVSVDSIASVDYYFSITGGQSSGARSTNSWTVGGLTPNTTYTFNAWTRANNQDSAQVSISVTTLANTPSAVTADAASLTQSSIRLNLPATGTDGNPSSTEYALYESTQNKYVQISGASRILGSIEDWRTLPVWTSPVTVSGLTANTAYTFKLKARNSPNNTETAFGTSATATTLSATTPRAPTLTSPMTTTATIIIDTTGLSAGLEFAMFEGRTSKYVQSDGRLAATPVVWKTYALWGGASGIGIIELSPSTSYEFKVKSRDPSNGNVESSFGPVTATSTTGTASGGMSDSTPPTRPSDLLYLQLSDGVKFTWTDPVESDFSRVLIFRAFENAAVTGEPLTIAQKGERQILDTGVLPGKKYSYLLRFDDTIGNGSMSQLIQVTIPQRTVVSTLPTSTELTVTQQPTQETTTRTTTRETQQTTTTPATPTTVAPTPLLERPAAREVGTNVKELLRSLIQPIIETLPTQQQPTTTTQTTTPAPTLSTTLSACADGSITCTANQLFRVEGIPESLRFIQEALVPSPSKREELRTTLSVNDPRVRIVGVFGTLYDLTPQGYSKGDIFSPSVSMAIRYNVRDARTIVLPTQRLMLAYFVDAPWGQWNILGDAVQDAIRGTFTATVDRAGTYGVVVVE